MTSCCDVVNIPSERVWKSTESQSESVSQQLVGLLTLLLLLLGLSSWPTTANSW